MAQLLKQVGFNVGLQAMDWSTLLMRRAIKKTPADKGGWNIFITSWSSGDWNPLYIPQITGNGEQGWFGWPTDAKLEKLKDDYLATTDAAQRKKIATAIQVELYENALMAPLGDYEFYSVLR